VEALIVVQLEHMPQKNTEERRGRMPRNTRKNTENTEDRRWSTASRRRILVGEEAGATGGLGKLIDSRFSRFLFVLVVGSVTVNIVGVLFVYCCVFCSRNISRR
jgi:hypothetical protein